MRNFKSYGSQAADGYMLALLSSGNVTATMVTIAEAVIERYQGEPVPLSFTELSDLTGKTYPSVNSAIKNLVKAGFIRKSYLPTRRMAERKNCFEPLLPDLKAARKAAAKESRAARLERECAEAAARWKAKAAAKPLAVVAES